MMCNGKFVVVFWIVLNVYIGSVESIHTEVECFPNGTITLTSPIPDSLYFAKALDASQMCNVTFVDPFELVVLTGCAKDENILVQLSEIEHTNNVVGGAGKVLITIMCQEITQGMERNFTQPLSVTLVANETVSFNQTFTAFSYIRNGSVTSPSVSSARILQELYFTYDLHKDYVVTFQKCTAYAGTDTTSYPNNHTLIENDCSMDTDLINSFASNKTEMVGNFTRYYTELTMFRFWVSLYITIECDVMICMVDSSGPCTMATCPNTRRRRSPEVDGTDYTDVQYRSSRATFEVLDNPDYVSSSYFLVPDILVLVLVTASSMKMVWLL